MAEHHYKERQEDELQVLQSIFLDDYEDLRRKDAWKVGRPPHVRITLKPQESFGSDGGVAHVQVDLVILCPTCYPDELPEMTFENHKGLSNQHLNDLKSDLMKEAKRLQGEEMLLELAQKVQTFLYSHNTPPPKSFYEEMIANKRKQEEKEAKEREKKLEFLRKKEEKEIQIIEDQVQRRQEALREETRKKRGEVRQSSDDNSSSTPSTPSGEIISAFSPIVMPSQSPRDKQTRTRLSESPSPAITQRHSSEQETRPSRRRRTSTPRCADEDNSCQQCKDHTGGIVVLAFNTRGDRTIHRGTCLGHGCSGSTVYVGIDTNSGELVAISEWIIKWRHVARKTLMNSKTDTDQEAETYRKQVISVEQELLSLLRLHHRNLVHYLAIKYQEEAGRITVYLLMEYAGGQNLDMYLTRKRLPMDMLRAFAEELLEALQYLHNKAVVHKNIKATSVFVDSSGRIRLADYSIDKRLSDMYQSVVQSQPGVKFTDKRSPVIGRGGKKGDIYQLGVLLLSLATGGQVEDIIPTISTSLPPACQDFLQKCLLKDERLRWSSYQLLDHEFLREAVPLQISPPVKDNEDENRDSEDEGEEDEEELPPFITAWEASGQSRLTSEFHVLKSLGKGGFGDVIKVKNKLDGRLYAIKRIPLNPKSQHFNKKITREVKLLSRLNHENVVRYYNSWIETSEDPAHSDTTSSLSGTPQTFESENKVSLPQNFKKNSLDLSDDIEKFAPQLPDVSVDFSISYEASSFALTDHGQLDEDEEEDEDDDDDDEDVFSPFIKLTDDSSDSIVFEHNFEDLSLSDSEKVKEKMKEIKSEDQSSSQIVPKLQYLYIQMEYCEKSTLRNCIDAGLHQDVVRVWRLFREIVEALVHIHEQGMIHRDLKPVNIFLDSNDHVKIGDFGLATSDIMSKGSLKDATLLMASACDIHDSLSRSGSVGDGNLTGKVGTALYVSPEMMTGENKVVYNQKVDIYSLGVIFFEMCHKPLPTGMERVKILSSLRSVDIVFPEDFDQVEQHDQTQIMRWLLNHEPSKRPTSKELLQSTLIPPYQMEEAELDEVLRSTISDSSSKPYRRLIHAMFSQNVSLADDHIYDSEIHKGSFQVRSVLTQRLVSDSLVRIFQRHGAVRLHTPLLVPRPQMYEQVDQYACLMDHSGKLVGLPFDLRVPFARYVARNNIHHMKRYCIEKVYREKVVGFHPRELTECAFDIITSTPGSLVPDAEVMVLVQEVINEFTPLQQRNYYYRINHTALLKAALLHVGIPEDQHMQVLTALSEVKRDVRSRSKVLSEFCVNEQASSTLLNLLEIEGQYGKVASILRILTKTKGVAGSLAKQGLHEIEAVISNAECLGLKLPVVVSVGWIHNTYQFTGVIFQVTVDMVRKKKTVSEVFAAGGRYDKLISQFYSPLFSSSKPVMNQSGVGISIAFEKIVTAMLEQEDFNPPSAYDVLVCTIGHKPMLKERMNLVRDLRNSGLKTEILLETLDGQEEIQDFCRKHGISQLVILKDTEAGFAKAVRVRSIERERVTEKVVNVSQLAEFLQQKIQGSKTEIGETTQPSTGKTAQSYQPNPDNVSHSQPTSNASNDFAISFTFLPQDGKLASNYKRKYEALIKSKVTTALPWLSLKCVDVLALDLTIAVLRVIVAFLEVNSTETAFEASIGAVVEKHPRHKKYMSKVTDHIHHLIYEKKCSCIVLYGMKDDSIKLLTTS